MCFSGAIFHCQEIIQFISFFEHKEKIDKRCSVPTQHSFIVIYFNLVVKLNSLSIICILCQVCIICYLSWVGILVFCVLI